MQNKDILANMNETDYEAFLTDYMTVCSRSVDHSGIAEIVAESILTALGLLGNGLVIFVLVVLREHLKSRPGWILIQMIIANSFYLVLFLFNIAEEGVGKWTMTDLCCKFQNMFITASTNLAIILLVVTNLERTITYAGSYFPHQIFSKCSVTVVRVAASLFIWLLCICGSIPQFQLASIDFCGQCTEVHPLTGEEICDYLQLNNTECYGFLNDVPKDYPLLEETWDNDYYLSAKESYDIIAQDFYYNQQALEISKHNASMVFPCRHDEPKSFFRILYIRFVFLFIIPVVSMMMSAIALYKYRKQIRPVVNSQRDASTGQWMMTVFAFNILFLICWVPFHVINLKRIRGISATPEACTVLLHYSKFSVMAYHTLFPYLYICLTRNFRHQILASCATVVYSLVERASKTSDFISMRRAPHSNSRPRDNPTPANGQ